MKRLAIAAACAAFAIGVGAPALAAQPTPTPAPTIASPLPSISMDQNTREVCTKSAETVTKGVTDFTTELGKVSTAASEGDLTAADKYVKNAGAILVVLSGQLRSDATAAQNPELKSALEDVAAEFQTLGVELNGLTALQDFDTKKLETVVDRMSALCGE